MTKLVFCFDGTLNTPLSSGDYIDDDSISNIVKLHALLGGKFNPKNAPNEKLPKQRSFYYNGIGTYGGFLRRMINATFSPIFMDEKRILSEANKDLAEVYHKRDEIFVFGFSRGAAIARIFAARLDKPVRFVGVFETVATSLLSTANKQASSTSVTFQDCALSDHVAEAVHLLAIDEQRSFLEPTLFNKDRRITEVWFAGVHADVGGGYWFDGLSDVTLDFMCQRATQCGLKFLSVDDIDYSALSVQEGLEEAAAIQITRDDITVSPTLHGFLHQDRARVVGDVTLLPRKLRVSVGGTSSSVDDDVPVVHYSVQERFRVVANYRPVALRNLRYCIVAADGVIEDKIRLGVEDLH